MPEKQSPQQKKTVERVMHEFKHGELKTAGSGPKVRSRRQATAIALHEAGASRDQSPSEQHRALRRTKRKEQRGETAKAESQRGSRERQAPRRQDLYDEAKRRKIPGRSQMNKAQLARALSH